MPVTFHSYEDTPNPPESVQKLIGLMQTPLYGAHRLASLPSMTAITLAHLRRIPDQVAVAEPSSSQASFDKVASMGSILLWTSAAIAETVERSEYDGLARPTTPHWYSLFGLIARNTHQDALPMGDIAFVYPRGFKGSSGTARMLVAFSADESLVSLNLGAQGLPDSSDAVPLCAERHLDLVTGTDEKSLSESGVTLGEEPQSDENEESDNKDSEDEDEASEEDADEDSSDSYDEGRDHPIYTAVDHYYPIPHHDEAELFFGLDLIDEHEPPEEPFLDLPLAAHILAGRRTWPDVLFPVLCVASEDEIVPLIASAACQRRAWGLALPVLGFELSKYGSVVRVHIGWVDPSSDVEHMPTVHILRPSPDAAASASQGIFDLAAPQSALDLASFMFSLDYQFDALRRELPSRRLDNFQWRCDSDDATWSASIRGWSQSVDALGPPSSVARSV